MERDKKGRFVKGCKGFKGMLGKKASKETKKKMSLSLKGRISPRKGLKMSEKQKKKISLALKGRIKSKKAYSFPRGKEHPDWKGGETMNNGYVFVTTNMEELKVKQNYTKRCNLIWFKHTGEIIKKPYCLHHKDNNKINDNFENLQKVTRSEHKKLHPKIQLKKSESICIWNLDKIKLKEVKNGN